MTTDQIDWDLACDGAPCLDFLAALTGTRRVCIERVSDDFADVLSSGYYVTWEGIIRLEQDLPLSSAEETAVDSLLPDDSDTCVYYVDDLPRPIKPWHDTLLKLAHALLVDRVDTIDAATRPKLEAWKKLEQALEEQAHALRLPPGCTSWRDVLSDQTLWRLGLHSCLSVLCGIGQYPELTLRDPDIRRYRIRDLIEELVERAECVRGLGLTLDGLLLILRMPSREKKILADTLAKTLCLESQAAPLAEPLEVFRARAAG